MSNGDGISSRRCSSSSDVVGSSTNSSINHGGTGRSGGPNSGGVIAGIGVAVLVGVMVAVSGAAGVVVEAEVAVATMVVVAAEIAMETMAVVAAGVAIAVDEQKM